MRNLISLNISTDMFLSIKLLSDYINTEHVKEF